jgi:hypothetical protein
MVIETKWLFLQDAMKHGAVKGTFYKFYYRCNEFILNVFCHSKEDFIKLINQWNEQSIKFCSGKFVYHYGSTLGRVEVLEPEGVMVNLKEIVEDQQVKDFSTMAVER